MMIRSAPPASAHFAESPVPGARADDRLPCVDLRAQPRERLGARHASLLDQLVEPVGHRDGEGVVVHVQLEPVRLDVAHGLAEAGEQGLVRLRVVEDAALGRDHRDALQRHEERRRRRSRRELAGRSGGRARAHSSGVVRISVTVGLCT